LWPSGIQYDRLLLFLSDEAAYMLASADGLQTSFPKILHVTCVAHGIHRLAEFIRENNPQVDALVSNGKKIFLKAPTRLTAWRNMCKDIPLPPEPVVTRWGTWIETAIFYSEHLASFASVVNTFDLREAASIRNVQNALSSPNLIPQLTFIRSKFARLSSVIHSLEARNLTLVESLTLVQ
jgi:hypothetical protein